MQNVIELIRRGLELHDAGEPRRVVRSHIADALEALLVLSGGFDEPEEVQETEEQPIAEADEVEPESE